MAVGVNRRNAYGNNNPNPIT